MTNSRKIDSFFEGQQSFNFDGPEVKIRQSKWLRVMKLFFPCLAGLLVIMLVVMPNIKKSVDLKDNITLPRKNEMEKLHMEQTVFSTTDKKNRVNTVIADSIDELEPGSQKIKIINPHGNIPIDNGMIDIKADTGYFAQDTNILDLITNVIARTKQNTIIRTTKATYDFKQELGYGNEKLFAQGNWGTLEADGFEFQKNNDLLTLTGRNDVKTVKEQLSAEEKTDIYLKQDKIVARGKAKIIKQNNTLFADTITIEFIAEKSPKEIKNLKANGNVILITDSEKVRGDYGYYDNNGLIEIWSNNTLTEIQKEDKILKAKKLKIYYEPKKNNELQKIEALENVEVITAKGSAYGSKGIYNPQENSVELFGNVKIEQDGNYIVGTYAKTDLNTQISRIKADESMNGRISGKFYKRKKNEQQ